MDRFEDDDMDSSFCFEDSIKNLLGCAEMMMSGRLRFMSGRTFSRQFS